LCDLDFAIRRQPDPIDLPVSHLSVRFRFLHRKSAPRNEYIRVLGRDPPASTNMTETAPHTDQDHQPVDQRPAASRDPARG
jgi:hypothetical protein